MKKIIINENQRGFLFKNGKYIQMLEPGKYLSFGGRKIEIFDLSRELISEKYSIDIILRDREVAAVTTVVEVKDTEFALHYVNGYFKELLTCGKHSFWTITENHEFKIIDTAVPEVQEDVPEYIFSKIPDEYYKEVEVAEYEKARLYYNNKFVRLLDSGRYYFWNNGTRVDVGFVDTRVVQKNINGQEILTLDKVAVRINFVCSYRVTDYLKIITEIDDFEEQLHIAAQLALREYAGKYKLDEILENKSQMSDYVTESLRVKGKGLYLEIIDAGVKDIILPGEIREIMNTVLVAEKRAQANVITRREEVASTRSLLNTAKLMEENQTLYKLKELEYVERICENVGNISLSGNGDILTQLTGIFKKTG